jgi:hypothetical protein
MLSKAIWYIIGRQAVEGYKQVLFSIHNLSSVQRNMHVSSNLALKIRLLLFAVLMRTLYATISPLP